MVVYLGMMRCSEGQGDMVAKREIAICCVSCWCDVRYRVGLSSVCVCANLFRYYIVKFRSVQKLEAKIVLVIVNSQPAIDSCFGQHQPAACDDR